MPKGSDLFVHALENEGVEYVFGVPGEETLDLLESLRQSNIRFIATRHEQAAAFMAATYGRLTGRPGVCLSTLGPGATNLVTGAAYALLGGMPMLMITGQKPIHQSKQARFQIIDAVGMMSPLTKQAKQIGDAWHIPAMVRDAFRIARQERPGPVHFELPEDVAWQTVDDISPVPVADTFSARASEDAIEQAVKLIEASRHPLIMIGGGANRPGLSPALSNAIGALGIPFFNTQMGKGAVDGRSDLFIGTAALSSGDLIHDIIGRSDVIMTVGHDTVEKPPFIMDANGPTVIHVNAGLADIDAVYSPQYEVIGEIGDALTRIAARLEGKSFNHDGVFAARDEMQKQIAQKADSGAFPILPQRLVSSIRNALSDDGILCLDNGMYKIWFARHYRTHISNTLLLDNALASMGAGLPSAIMAAMLNLSRRVICVCGDGGFMMSDQELETAIRLGLRLTVVIIEDHAYGMIRWKQESDGFTDFGMTFGNPDFVELAKSFGAGGRRVTSADDFDQALAYADKEGGVQVIVTPIDYSENRIFGDAIGTAH
ncbi:MAG: acetolactate synthase large subunit [Hyphomicrobiales bacterium]|nr:acetolactate synthase large subunit [Hyphomicrobiales bacterium]